MESNKLSARSPIVRELGVEKPNIQIAAKSDCFYIFTTHFNSKTLQHKRILCTNDTHTPIRLAQNSHTFGMREPGGTAR